MKTSLPRKDADSLNVYGDNPDESVDSLLGLLTDSKQTKSAGYKSIAPAGRFLNFVVLLLLIGAIAACLIVFIFLRKKGGESNDCNDLSVCYRSPSCPANNNIPYNPEDGFTNDTGWSSNSDSENLCCSICLATTKTVNCFNASDVACSKKTGNGDYDYLMLDQMWLPQFCSALQQGHDFTLTHLAGTKCIPGINKYWSSNLSIHGLWPNYYSGFPQCCPPAFSKFSSASLTIPLTPAEVATWQSWPELQYLWMDPTISNENNCSVCSMWNHEWQKHGTCLSTTYSKSSQEQYFVTALNISKLLSPISEKINMLGGRTLESSTIAGMYPRKVNVICDPNDVEANLYEDTGIFSEIQSCWLLTGEASIADVGGSLFSMVNCSKATPAKFTTPCPKYVIIKIY